MLSACYFPRVCVAEIFSWALTLEVSFLPKAHFYSQVISDSLKAKKKKMSGRSGLCCKVMSQQNSPSLAELGSCPDCRRPRDDLSGMWGAQGCRRPWHFNYSRDMIECSEADVMLKGEKHTAKGEGWTLYRSDFEL